MPKSEKELIIRLVEADQVGAVADARKDKAWMQKCSPNTVPTTAMT